MSTGYLMNANLLTSLWWIVLLVVSAITLAAIAFSFFYRKKISDESGKTAKEAFLDALGGRDNILSASLNGSRIVLKLASTASVDREALKKSGITGFVLLSDKLTLVSKDHAAEIYEEILGD
jgi:phosphotransferase system IIB component